MEATARPWRHRGKNSLKATRPGSWNPCLEIHFPKWKFHISMHEHENFAPAMTFSRHEFSWLLRLYTTLCMEFPPMKHFGHFFYFHAWNFIPQFGMKLFRAWNSFRTWFRLYIRNQTGNPFNCSDVNDQLVQELNVSTAFWYIFQSEKCIPSFGRSVGRSFFYQCSACACRLSAWGWGWGDGYLAELQVAAVFGLSEEPAELVWVDSNRLAYRESLWDWRCQPVPLTHPQLTSYEANIGPV